MNYANDESSSKKKLLVPLVVLLLCGVAMTGAAYAYNSSLDISAGEITEGKKDLSVDLATGEYTTDVVFSTANLVFTDHISYEPAKNVAVKCWASDFTATYKLKISGDADVATLAVKTTGLTALLDTQIGDKKFSEIYTVTIAIGTENQNVTADGTFTATAKTGTVDVVLTFTASKDAVTVQGATAADAENCHNAAYFKANTDFKGFAMNFVAAPATTA